MEHEEMIATLLEMEAPSGEELEQLNELLEQPVSALLFAHVDDI